ncbi:MAG: hypothetical protein DMD82_09695 [Candidatus Rokuibacteriota bacterium]|nr:MAG: hypothetical protein DMD82_09695 [Candidatus Rokubacteria bacterium]
MHTRSISSACQEKFEEANSAAAIIAFRFFKAAVRLTIADKMRSQVQRVTSSKRRLGDPPFALVERHSRPGARMV